MQAVISFTQIVEQIASDAFAAAIATKNGLNASRDLYHLQMAIREHGEEAVVLETARVLQARYRCSFAEASVDAGNRVRAALELVSGVDTFQTVRNNLNRP
ncbi:hypothetical protein [Pseudomonas parafulva]|uniref:Prophage PssSM-01 n=1 Tax=Pseudomonas parafulva TaxID=157782 RepID=A0ABN4Y0G8_9PSED|nr:hypothetical protein [Pseudomonas parafulva]AQW70405.1 hypothetical protein B2J77_20320 [Pseudomonas parafulva]WHU42095.1 hypothetical protein OXL99_25320 [Pseudomonas fulva]